MAESWPGARKLCLFYRPWQLTGYWEQRPNDTATQQISTSSASCSSEQIRSLPPLRHNRATTAKQPPAKRAPTLAHRKTSWSGLSLGHSCIKGSFPSPWPTPTPIGKMCVFQVSKYCHLPESSMTSPFGGGGRVAYCACLLCNRGTCGLTQQPVHRMGQGNSPGTAGVSKSNIPI